MATLALDHAYAMELAFKMALAVDRAFAFAQDQAPALALEHEITVPQPSADLRASVPGA